MLSVGRHAKVTAYGKGGEARGMHFRAGAENSKGGLFSWRDRTGPARKNPEGWCLGETGEREIRSHSHVRPFALNSAGLTAPEVGKPRESTAAGR